ncbi:MAG: TonB-dependent receptor, partial [Bacteroidaceae bacterium]|nr:TonB-dependent receptor [Bacteroidaceae bacterium]
MRKLFLLLLLVLSTALYAQKKDGTLTAEIYNKETGEAMTSAIVQLYSLPDSLFKVGATSDLDGKISVKVNPGKFFAKVSYVGCRTITKDIVIEAGKVCELGRIDLVPTGKMLDDVVVSEEVPPVVAAEDTLVFNTAAFRVPEGSMLEELIKKYPGVDIAEDGTIKINGKTVNRILMKGKDFFGTDKDMALKNISVDAVDKVKFYDKKSDFSRITGIDDGEEETVLDLQMKKGVADGFFSNSDAGGGADFNAEHLLYRLRNTTSYYNDNAQYTLVLSANNVGDQGFSDGRGRGFGGFGGGGISSPKRAGFNFAYENEKIEFGGNVRGDHVSNDVKSWTSTETFMPQIGRNQFSNSRSAGLSGRMNLNANFRFEWKPDTMTNIILTPTVSYSDNESWNESHSATFNENPFDYEKDYTKELYGDVSEALDSIAVNENANKSLSMGENFSTSARLQVNRRLNKPGRNVTLRGNYSYSYSESESFSLNNVNYFQVAGMATRQQRYSTTPGKNWSYNVNLSYTEPLLKNLFLQLNYSYNQSYSNSDRATYRFDDLADYILEVSPDFTRPELPADLAPYLDNDLSRFSTYRTQRHEAGATFRYVTEKINLNAGVTWLPQ